MTNKQFYNIDDMAQILSKTRASIYGHLARRQYDVVPYPMKLGRTLVWLKSDVDSWIEKKAEEARLKKETELQKLVDFAIRRPGRPRKGE